LLMAVDEILDFKVDYLTSALFSTILTKCHLQWGTINRACD
jgi:hypothetical protein